MLNETIDLILWDSKDWECAKSKKCILSNLGLKASKIRKTNKKSQVRKASPIDWSPRPLGFVKLDFNGASNGNLGLTNY